MEAFGGIGCLSASKRRSDDGKAELVHSFYTEEQSLVSVRPFKRKKVGHRTLVRTYRPAFPSDDEALLWPWMVGRPSTWCASWGGIELVRRQ